MFVPFYPRHPIKVYVSHRLTTQLVPVRGRTYTGWYKRNKPKYKIHRIIESVATLDPPVRRGLKRNYFSVKYSGRDWDYYELARTKQQADERRIYRDTGKKFFP